MDLDGIKIMPFVSKDFDDVLDIHKQCFKEFGSDYSALRNAYKKIFTPERTSIAKEKDSVIGFCCYQAMQDPFLADPDMEKDITAHLLGDNYSFKQTFKSYPHTIWSPYPKDIEIISLGVLETHRSKGIGKKLVEATLENAQSNGALTAYAHCWEKSVSKALFELLDFRTIAYYSPVYPDGSGTFFMGKNLI